jgi:putative ABC transport system ATP-binding protein
VWALREVDAAFDAGRLSVLAGPSGSGKSSLLRILGGLDRPAQGSVRVGGVELAEAPARVRRFLQREVTANVFQEPASNLLAYLDVQSHLALWRRLRRIPSTPAAPYLEAVGLSHRATALPGTLSGGEQQRLALAAAVAAQPRVVLADEPTSQLDRSSARAVIEALLNLRDLGATLVVASHDPDLLEAADAGMVLDHGVVVAGAGSGR